MAKVNRVADLPDWFDLDNYNGTKDFGAAEWVEQLELRREILECFPSESLAAEQKARDTWDGVSLSLMFVSGIISRTREAPVRPINNPVEWALNHDVRPVKPFNLLEQREQLVNDNRAVHEGQAPQWLMERWGILNQKGCGWEVYNPRTHEEEQRINQLRIPFVLTDYSDSNNETPVISIDLKATDAVLIAAFESWLKGARALSPEISKRNRPAYNDWSRYGLLPYLDLLIWSKETGRHIPHRVLSEAVSIYNKGESSFGKTVVPLAARLMDDLSELRALAVHEELAQTE